MDFQGFQHTLPFFLVALVAASLLVVSWLSYRKLHSIPAIQKAGLIALRSSVLLILLILLLNPYFFSKDTVRKNPKILFLMDNSESVTITKGVYEGLESYQQVLSDISASDNTEDVVTEYFTIGSSSRQIASPDSLNFDESETNFTNAVSQIQELQDDFNAAVIVSDGIITYGRNPIIQASDLSIPLLTIGLGDTSKVQDITISDVSTNGIGYTNTRHPVQVEIAQNGFKGLGTQVRILDSDGTAITEDRVEFSADEEVRTLTVELVLEEAGLKQFTVQMDSLDQEWSTKNNQTTFSIDVTDSKIRIAHLAFEIHPDVKMIRDILSSDQNIELTTLTWLGGTRFVEDALPVFDDQDLIILHGLPPSGSDLSFTDEIPLKPTLYFQLPRSRTLTGHSLSEIQLIDNTGRRLFRVGLIPNAGNSEHPILELPEVGYQNLPPLISSLQTSQADPSAEFLFNSTFQGVESPNAVLAISSIGSLRRATVTSWGWYKLYQSTLPAEREFVSALIMNLANWTSNDPDDRRLTISPTKSTFNVSEEVVLNANLNNESGEPEPDGIIEITITDRNSEFERTFNMSNNGSGAYDLSISALASGLYTYRATARKGEREIDTQTGEFLVKDSNMELINTVRNDDLLSSLASETGGEFITFDRSDQLWPALNERGLLDAVQEEVEIYIYPVRHLFWFLIVLGLLTAEWFLRKFYSLP